MTRLKVIFRHKKEGFIIANCWKRNVTAALITNYHRQLTGRIVILRKVYQPERIHMKIQGHRFE